LISDFICKREEGSTITTHSNREGKIADPSEDKMEGSGNKVERCRKHHTIGVWRISENKSNC
jgi:hypothetical protein